MKYEIDWKMIDQLERRNLFIWILCGLFYIFLNIGILPLIAYIFNFNICIIIMSIILNTIIYLFLCFIFLKFSFKKYIKDLNKKNEIYYRKLCSPLFSILEELRKGVNE